MKERIIVVEDEVERLSEIKCDILSWVDSEAEVLTAKSLKETIAIAESGSIDYGLLDLKIPKVYGGSSDCTNGFEAIKILCKKNPYIQISIISSFSDNIEVAEEKNRLIFEGFPIKRVLNKGDDAFFLEKIKPDIVGLGAMKSTLKELGIRLIHPLERRVARRLWSIASNEQNRWPTPFIVLRGEPGAGKDTWARAFIRFIELRQPNLNRIPHVEYDLGLLTEDKEGDSGKRALFGSRNYGGGYPDSKGIFERATAYLRGGRQLASHQLARGTDEVDFSSSSVAWLSELGNLPANCQKLMLRVLDDNPSIGGSVIPVGTDATPIRIGCPIVFTTNANIESNIVDSDTVIAAGQIRRDLYDRLENGNDAWIRLPSAHELGYCVFLDHLLEALHHRFGRNIEVASAASSLLKEAFDRKLENLSMRTISSIVEAVHNDGSDRVRDDHVLPTLRIAIPKRGVSQPRLDDAGNGSIKHWGIQDFEKAGIVSKLDKEYYILMYLLEQKDKQVNAKDIIAWVDESEELAAFRAEWRGGWIAYRNSHALAEAVNRLRKKINRDAVVGKSNVKLSDRGYCVKTLCYD